MATPIISTKLYRPVPRPTILRRPRLLAQLHAGVAGPLTLLSAPAGCGKTTLLAEGLAASPHPVAWLSLEEAERVLPRFLTYLVAAQLTTSVDLPQVRARVALAQGDVAGALGVLVPWQEEVERRGWADARLQGLVLEGLARQAAGEWEQAVAVVQAAVELGEPAGCVRSFVEAGPPLVELLRAVVALGVLPEYVERLLAACAAERQPAPSAALPTGLVEPLSRREEEVLRLIAQGLSNQEIAERLVVALDTVKGHNHKIFSKLQVQRRTEAVARARELGLL